MERARQSTLPVALDEDNWRDILYEVPRFLATLSEDEITFCARWADAHHQPTCTMLVERYVGDMAEANQWTVEPWTSRMSEVFETCWQTMKLRSVDERALQWPVIYVLMALCATPALTGPCPVGLDPLLADLMVPWEELTSLVAALRAAPCGPELATELVQVRPEIEAVLLCEVLGATLRDSVETV